MTYLVIFNNKWKRILAEKSSLSVYKIRKKVYNRNSLGCLAAELKIF